MASHDYNDDEIDDRSFYEKYRVQIFMGIAVVIILAIGLTCFMFLSKGKISHPRKPEEIHVTLVPPPPPPRRRRRPRHRRLPRSRK